MSSKQVALSSAVGSFFLFCSLGASGGGCNELFELFGPVPGSWALDPYEIADPFECDLETIATATPSARDDIGITGQCVDQNDLQVGVGKVLTFRLAGNTAGLIVMDLSQIGGPPDEYLQVDPDGFDKSFSYAVRPDKSGLRSVEFTAMDPYADDGDDPLSWVLMSFWVEPADTPPLPPLSPPSFPDPTVACCFGDGRCMNNLAEWNCSGQGGTYMGDNVSCDAANCPEPPDEPVDLGDATSTTQNVTISVRDQGWQDGDRVRLKLNDMTFAHDHPLTIDGDSWQLGLRDGTNVLKIEALNTGIDGPNTAQIQIREVPSNYLIFDKHWRLETGEVAVVEITY